MHHDTLEVLAPERADSPIDEAQVLGSAVWLWMHSAAHRDAPLHSLSTLLLPAIKRRQFILISEGGRPVFFLSWLRSKFGARIYHNNRQLQGAPLLLVNQSDLPLEPHLWLSAWLASSADCPVEVFDWPLPAGELALAVEHLQPRAVLLYSSKALHLPTLGKLLAGVPCPTLLAGPTVCIHQAELAVLTSDIPQLCVAEDPLSAHQLLIQRGIV